MREVKTNAVRILENLGIAYTLLKYEIDVEDLAAERSAEKVNIPAHCLFKSLVA